MRALIALILFFIFTTHSYSQVTIDPGESYTPEQIICTACAPEHLPDVKVVDPSGAGDYATIFDANAAAEAGWLILVKDGTYDRRIDIWDEGLTIAAYPGHNPVLDLTNSPDQFDRVEINADNVTIRGLEIKGGYEGIKISGRDNVKIVDNYIHHNDSIGVHVVDASNALIERNIIESNSTSHGIYLSDFSCNPMSGNVIRYNHIKDHAGKAIQTNRNSCTTEIQSTVIEYNRIENNSWGIVLFYTGENTVIQNNTFIGTVMPTTTDTDHFFIALYGVENNTVESNVFYSTLEHMTALGILDDFSKNNTFNENVWTMKSNWWIWGGTWRSDWLGYQNITGWDADGAVTVQVVQ